MTVWRAASASSATAYGGSAGPAGPTLWDRRRYIHFHGEAFGNASQASTIDVMAAEQPPTITDGYGQWTTVSRPLRRALQIFTGYDAIAMQFGVRFMQFDQYGSWLQDDTAGERTELQIAGLEWMAGSSTIAGPPPLVWLSTYDSAGNTNPLIPFDYQNGSPSVPSVFADPNYAPKWVLTALQWDTSPIRNADGYRVRQDCMVTATMYIVPAGQTTNRGVARAKSQIVWSSPGQNTAMLIARHVNSQNPTDTAKAIMKDPHNASLDLRYVNQTIPIGKRVFVPARPNA